MPAWVTAGFDDFAKRMPREARLSLIEIKPEPRGEGGRDVARLITAEGRRIRAALPKDALKIVLDERGSLCTTTALAERYALWRMAGRDIALIIGGPDGLAPAIKQDADFVWSLSPLTLPHTLVRVVVVEQLYRAHTISEGHPYHRA